MNIFKSYKEYFGFDDRWFILFGIIILSCTLPILMDHHQEISTLDYWRYGVTESLVFVTIFWLVFRVIIKKMRIWFPHINETIKRLLIQELIIIFGTPILKVTIGSMMKGFLFMCNFENPIYHGGFNELVLIYLPLTMIIAIYEAVYFFVLYKESIIEKEQLERAHVQVELNNLRNQINPHFLFNSLNTLMNLIPNDPDRAMSFLSKLSKFYRYSVSTKEEKLIPLSKEIEFANLYIDLLKERFRDALEVRLSVENTANQMIPPLSLQLLIENAIKHNVISKNMPLQVEIVYDNTKKEVTISNNLQMKMESVKSTGMGLENIKKRFQFFTKKPVLVFQDLNIFSVTLPTLSA